jgi:hypothetical protein
LIVIRKRVGGATLEKVDIVIFAEILEIKRERASQSA